MITAFSAPKPRYITRTDQVAVIPDKLRAELAPVCGRYAFRTNDYYLSLINWADPRDPIRRIVIPDKAELEPWGRLDASDESDYTVAPGAEHKYPHTVVLLVNDVCGSFCRFCFRKRLFMNGNAEVARDIGPGLAHIRRHEQITNVLLSGGDPLILSTGRLRDIISRIRSIGHVRIIRIGTKIPAFNPMRITRDPALVEMLRTYISDRRRIYIMVHFNHPRELTDEAVAAVRMLQEAGAIVCNQTPLLRGVNDDPYVLGELLRTLSFAGIPPYYVFQGRPTAGNAHFAVPVERGLEIFEQARMLGSGLAKRVRFAMSHATGKIEIVGMNKELIFFRYHRAADPDNRSRFMLFRRNPEAYWFDDYTEPVCDFSFDRPEKRAIFGTTARPRRIAHRGVGYRIDHGRLADRRHISRAEAQ